jgi:hypothetical protein
MAVVEVENRTAVPFALAFAIVPYGPLGAGAVRSIELRGDHVEIDGGLAVILPKPPLRVAGGTSGRTSTAVVGGEAVPPEPVVVVRDRDGLAELAVVYPVPHASGLRVLLPLDEAPPRSSIAHVKVAPADDVARGWTAHVDRGPRLELPDDRVRVAFEAARRDLLLFHAGDDVLAWPQAAVPWTTTAQVVGALDLLGLHAEAEQVLRAVPDEQKLDGGIISPDEGPAANGAALMAIGSHWHLTHDDDLVDDLVGSIAKAAHWIEKRRGARRRPLLAIASYADALWCIAGLRSTVAALASIGQPEVAEDVARFAATLHADVGRALAADRQRSGTAVPPRSPGAEVDPRAAENLVAAYLDVLEPDAEPLVALVSYVRERAIDEAGLVVADGGAGSDPRRTLELALAELRTSDPLALGHVAAVLDRATPARTWPQVIHPRSGGGARGHGQDPATTALFCTVVRALLVHEDAPDRLALARAVPDAWLGQSWEVRHLPTAAGSLGYAVRWHGERPALLWELEPWEGSTPVTLTVPGLDPSWSSRAPAGEALLAPIARPDRSVRRDRPDAGGTEASSSFA